MSDATRPQTWEIVNESSLEVLETGNRESLDNLLEILNSKFNFPFRISLTGSVVTIHESELQTLKSDNSEWGGTENSFKYATAPIDGQYKKIVESTLDLADGTNTGDFASGVFESCPTLSVGDYVWMGLEAKSSGDISVVWGNPDADLNYATYPTFSATAICLIKLKANAPTTTGVEWGSFDTILPEDVIVFKGSGGGSGGAGSNDFVPLYKSSTEYRLQSTQGRSTRFNEQYFSIGEDVDFSYDLAEDKTWYICIDTNQAPGIINTANKDTYITEVDVDQNSPSFPQNLVILGYYEVVGGSVSQLNLGTYSPRAVDTFVGDLTASFESNTEYRIQSSRGRLVRANDKYFYLSDNNDLVKSFNPGATGAGTWFICLDTSGDGTELTLSHLIETQLDPANIAFPQHYAPLAVCEVSASGSDGVLSTGTFRTISDREINTLQGDFIPSYLDNDTFVVNHSFGRKVRLLADYFYSETNIVESFDKSASGTWYIVIDTADIAGPGELTASHIKFTVEDPAGPSFDPDFVAIAEYIVEADLTTVSYSNFRPYSVGGAGSAGSTGDFVPLYFDGNSFSIRSTNGSKVNFNNKYYYTTQELSIDYDKSASGIWYINVNTEQPQGEITSANQSDYMVMTQIAPYAIGVNPYHITLGEYYVDEFFEVSNDSVKGYSTREHTTWVNGIPNIWKKTDTKYASANDVVLAHNFGQTPDIVTFKYWDNSASKFINLYSADLEQSRNNDQVIYNIPSNTSHPFITWDLGDYFEIQAIKYAYAVDGGFASPKTDYATDWYSTIPATIITHPLAVRPQNISLEFLDLTGTPVYYVEDGLQYVDKNTGGIGSSSVTFDWTPLSLLPVPLGPTLKMRIHFNVSKLSAGAFEASKGERGTVSVTGDSSTVMSPDILLTALDTNFATTLNSMGANITVLVTESIVVTEEQNITGIGISFNMLPGTYISTITPGLTSIVKFSGEDYEVENIRIKAQEDVTSGLLLNADGIVKNYLFKQDASGKTAVNAVEVASGNIATVFGRSKAVNGTITNKISDVDGNSEITIS